MAFHQFMGDARAQQAQWNPATGMHASAYKVKAANAPVAVAVAQKRAGWLVAGRTIKSAAVAPCSGGNVIGCQYMLTREVLGYVDAGHAQNFGHDPLPQIIRGRWLSSRPAH